MDKHGDEAVPKSVRNQFLLKLPVRIRKITQKSRRISFPRLFLPLLFLIAAITTAIQRLDGAHC